MIVLQWLLVIAILLSPYFFLLFYVWFSKWLGAIAAVLTGDKKGLQNLCKDDPPIFYQEHWQEKWNKQRDWREKHYSGGE